MEAVIHLYGIRISLTKKEYDAIKMVAVRDNKELKAKIIARIERLINSGDLINDVSKYDGE